MWQSINIHSKGFLVYIVAPMILTNCKKQDDFLNTIPNMALTTPTTLGDYQLMIQNETYFNYLDPSLEIASTDEYYITDARYVSLDQTEKNIYTWAGDVYPNMLSVPDWDFPYQCVYNANVILEGLAKLQISKNEVAQYNFLKGAALFFRAKAFFHLLGIFSEPYDSMATQMGIPLRLSSDINKKYSRASEKECYSQVIADLQQATSLLPSTTVYITEPSNLAAKGFLARVYLAIGRYSDAWDMADKYLSQNSTLTDYNQVITNGFRLSKNYLSEDIFHSSFYSHGVIAPFNYNVDTALYSTYDSNDLRRKLFFRKFGQYNTFSGSYDVTKGGYYSGIATDEIYLIRAECAARKGDALSAMNDLNRLLMKRYVTGTFAPLTAADPDDALNKVLLERRKELLFRGLRWYDLRRLNKEPKLATTLYRRVNGESYMLPANDKRYALPIPSQEVLLSGLQQNPR